MANAFQKPERLVAQGLGLLQRQLVLPRLVTRKGIADFQGNKNDALNIRIDAILRGRDYEYRTRNSPIEMDDLVEYVLSVRLDKHPLSAVRLTDEELTLDLDNWGQRVGLKQVRAVAERLESYIAQAMERNARYRHTVTYVPGSGGSEDFSFHYAAVDANKYLNIENVPQDGRVILLGANVEAAALRSPHLFKVDQAGTDEALRYATLGYMAGFRVIGRCNSIDPDFAIAMHPTAFAFANVAPAVPEGATKGATMTYEGLALRWIKDYDTDYMRDRSVYSAFAGAASVEDGRDLREDSRTYGELTGENVRAVEIAFTPGS